MQDSQTQKYVSGTITNNDGCFMINKINGSKIILSISSLGYSTKQLYVGLKEPTNILNINLSPDTISLSEVTVTWKPLVDYNREGDIALNIDLMGNVGELSLADIITSIPGLRIDIDGNVLYGGYNSFTTLINGERIGSYNGGKPGFILTGIAAKNIKRVEVITEPNGRFGFYTPVINIIPKGDLRDIYYASAGIGVKDKYAINLDLSKKYKKLTFRPVIDYQHTSLTESQNEEQWYNNTKTDREITSLDKKTLFKPASFFRYSPDRKEHLTININYNKTNYKQHRYSGLINKPNIPDLIENRTEEFDASTAYYKRIDFSYNQYLLINAKISSRFNHNNGWQNQSGTLQQQYSSHKKDNNYLASLSLSHNIIGKKLVWNFNGSINYNYNNGASNRKQFNATTNTWDKLNHYTANRQASRIMSTVNAGVSRLIRTQNDMSHYFKLQLKGILRREGRKLHEEDYNISYYQYLQQNFNYRLSMKARKQILLRFNNQITPPTYQQLYQALTYVDDYTLKAGNPNLKHSTNISAFLSLGKNINYTRITQGHVSKGSDIEKIGYSIEVKINTRLNEIIQEIQRNNEGVIFQTWKNADKSLNTSLSTNIEWNMMKNTKLFATYNYNYDSFYSPQYVQNKSWSTNIQLRSLLPAKLYLDTKATYYSESANYNLSTSSYFDIQAKIYRFFSKKRLRITVSATNLLSDRGIRKINNDGNTIVISNKYPESPIIWLKVKFLLFSYYKKV